MSEATGPTEHTRPEPEPRPARPPRVRRAVAAETWMLTETLDIPRPRRPRP